MREQGRALGIDPTRTVGAGDGAGGQMTAGLAMYLRDHKLEPLKAMVMIYPALGADVDTGSSIRNAQEPSPTRDEMIFYRDSFLGPRESKNWHDPYAVPMLAGNLEALPPTFISVALHDPLCDDGILFAAKLEKAGVPVALHREPALAHSFMRARHVSEPAKKGFDAIVEALRTLSHDGCLP
jgi:acetyl esterase